MNDRERFIACILGQPLDRPPYWLFWGPWGSTWRRWEREGKPARITDHRMAFAPDVRPNPIPVNCGPRPRLEKTIIEESDDYVVFTDAWGILRRDFRHSESMEVRGGGPRRAGAHSLARGWLRGASGRFGI